MSSRQLMDRTLEVLDFSLKGRDDFFLTTSFGYQSEMLFFMMAELGLKPKCLYVRSHLALEGVNEQMEYLLSKYDVDLTTVDRNEWLETEMGGLSFMDLPDLKRKYICKQLKRAPLLEYIKNKSCKIWLSGIRRDQTSSRSETKFMSVTDLSVIKLSPLFSWSKPEVKSFIFNNQLRVNSRHFDLCKVNENKECGLHV